MSKFLNDEPLLKVFSKETNKVVGRVDNHYINAEAKVYCFEDQSLEKSIPVYFINIHELLNYLGMKNYKVS